MKNLAGIEECDQAIRQELASAGIEIDVWLCMASRGMPRIVAPLLAVFLSGCTDGEFIGGVIYGFVGVLGTWIWGTWALRKVDHHARQSMHAADILRSTETALRSAEAALRTAEKDICDIDRTLGAAADEETLDAAKRVVAERDEARRNLAALSKPIIGGVA